MTYDRLSLVAVFKFETCRDHFLSCSEICDRICTNFVIEHLYCLGLLGTHTFAVIYVEHAVQNFLTEYFETYKNQKN